MKNILLFGAGRSSSSLIRYLLDNSQKEEWKLTVCDQDEVRTKTLLNGHPNGEFVKFSIEEEELRLKLIMGSDLVISMLPAKFHPIIAFDCFNRKKHFVTASYVDQKIKGLDEGAKEEGVIFLMECGLDPGIDHMSAMHIIDRIKSDGGKLLSFESYTGGLIAPESDDNPWHYKFTWAPKNVVVAGQGTAKFIQKGMLKYIPYHRLFNNLRKVDIKDVGIFEGYYNRDSLIYREAYGIEDIPTLIRGTLRADGYCSAWNLFVQLGLTDDTYTMNTDNYTWRDFVNTFLPYHDKYPLEEKLHIHLGIDLSGKEMKMIEWLEILSKKKIGLKEATPADILLKLLEEKWKLEAHDKDMIVMWHHFIYELDGKQKELQSYLVDIGTDQTYTAMAKTVGTPVGIAVKNILNGKIKLRGVQIPVKKQIYEPILKELREFGIEFKEKEG